MIKKKTKKPWPRLRITDNYKHNAFDKRMMHPNSGIQTIIDNDYFENRDPNSVIEEIEEYFNV